MLKRRSAGNARGHPTHLYGEVQKFRPPKMQGNGAIRQMEIAAFAHIQLKGLGRWHRMVLLYDPVRMWSQAWYKFLSPEAVVNEEGSRSGEDQVKAWGVTNADLGNGSRFR